MNSAAVVEADLVVDHEVVPLAGRRHVIVTVRADFDRAAQTLCRDRRNGRELVRLRFLTPEAAAHPADFHRHRVRRHAKRMRHHMLHFARVLRGGIDRHVLILAGHGHGDMAFEIEMVLSADAHPAFDPPWRVCQRYGRIAACKRQRRSDQFRTDGIEVGNIDDRRQLVIFDLGQPAGPAGLFACLRNHREYRLPEELHLAVGKNRLVMPAGRADIVFAGHVGSQQHVDHAGRSPHC